VVRDAKLSNLVFVVPCNLHCLSRQARQAPQLRSDTGHLRQEVACQRSVHSTALTGVWTNAARHSWGKLSEQAKSRHTSLARCCLLAFRCGSAAQSLRVPPVHPV
jgi:hypothetical protein